MLKICRISFFTKGLNRCFKHYFSDSDGIPMDCFVANSKICLVSSFLKIISEENEIESR